jgi:DNA-binding IclR family transcriptional regulator
MPAAEERAKLNQSVKKAIMLLRATAEDGKANVSSLARAAGLPRATALRMIRTLEQEGFLLRIPGDDRVLLGPELLRLASKLPNAAVSTVQPGAGDAGRRQGRRGADLLPPAAVDQARAPWPA